jgi:hypothetical protein
VSWSNWATVADLGTALGWHFYPDWRHEDAHAPLDEFRRQTRDLYIPVGDIGFWQGALREPGDPSYSPARKVIEDRQPWTVEFLYGDHGRATMRHPVYHAAQQSHNRGH